MLTLPRIPFLKSPVKAVEDQSLVPAPQGREQKLFGTVPCNPVNGHVRGKQFHAVNHKVKVFLHGKYRKGRITVNPGQVSAFQDVEQLKLYAVSCRSAVPAAAVVAASASLIFPARYRTVSSIISLVSPGSPRMTWTMTVIPASLSRRRADS